VAKIQSFLMLTHAVHTPTNMTPRGNPTAVRDVLFSSHLCYCQYTELMNGYSSRFVVYIFYVLFSEHEKHGKGEKL